jgi:copper chaperone
MTQVTLNVPDISCAHCEKTIVEALRGKDGVQAVVVSIPTKHVLLKYDETRINLDEVKGILDEEGYPVATTQS